MAEYSRYVIGVDGGGTKTHALLVALDGSVIAEALGGGTNLQTVGIPHAARIVLDLITDCCSKEKCQPEALQSVVLGIAGAGRSSDRAELVDTLLSLSQKKKFPLRNVRIETDARIALEAAFAGGPGLVVIAGTGSIALYRTEDGKILRSGGWGRVLGDEGSGYMIGRDGLNAVMRQHDGRGDKTVLTKKALEHFAVPALEDLIPKIHNDQGDVATFAPRVLEAVAERDRVAHTVIMKNANDLVEMVRNLTMQVRPKKKLPVALMGGLLETENVFSKMVKDKIISSLPHLVVQKPKFSAAFGAAIIGLNAFR